MHSQTSLHRPAITEDGPDNVLTQSTTLAFCLNTIHSLTLFCIGGVAVCALLVPIILHTIPLTISMQHMILCTVGYFFLMANAVFVFSPFGFASTLEYEHKRLIHAVMQIGGSALAIAGGTMQLLHIGTWLSAHGLFGIISLAFTVVTLIGGVLNFIMTRREKKRWVTILHASLGTLTIITAYLCLIFAFSAYYRWRVGIVQTNFSIGLGCFALIGTIIIASSRNIIRICSGKED